MPGHWFITEAKEYKCSCNHAPIVERYIPRPSSEVMATTPAPPFSFSTRLGIVFIVESASISAIAESILLLYIAVRQGNLPNLGSQFSHFPQYNAISSRKWPMETFTHYYILNLLVS